MSTSRLAATARRGRMYLNLLIVFFLSGFWHGAGFHFLVWGMLHGVLYVATRFWQGRVQCRNDNSLIKQGSKAMTLVSQIATFLYVSVAWVYFRAENIRQANTLLRTACAGEVKRFLWIWRSACSRTNFGMCSKCCIWTTCPSAAIY